MKATGAVTRRVYPVPIAAAALCLVAASPAQEPALFSDKAERTAFALEAATRAQAAKLEAVEWARVRGLPVRHDDGMRLIELMAIREGRPYYYITHNVNAAISTAADQVRNTAPYNLNGGGWTVGVWDGGAVLSTHQEFGSRVTVQDGSSAHYHATHVGGTIAAAGVDASALGMAPSVDVSSYRWDYDIAEMASAASSYPGESGKIPVSNHSYGSSSGWTWTDWATEPSYAWHWSRYATWGQDEDGFGQYNSDAKDWDQIVYYSPYYLPFKSAGNDRNDDPANGDTVYYSTDGGSSWNSKTYDDSTDTLGDGVYESGYDTVATHGVAKNIVTVGAVNDAVSGGSRSTANATMSSFSGWGPADDGRIKPDVVANGVSLYSTYTPDNDSYDWSSGTSMSTPNACGSAVLLAEYFDDLFPGHAMRASTLKGLIIHTADDLDSSVHSSYDTGPDYASGWGLMDTEAAADHIKAYYDSPANQKVVEGLLTTANATDSYTFTWNGADPIRVTVCWTDPPGTASTAHDDTTSKLVNDLDLVVTGPGGSPTYSPYVLDRTNPSDPATTGENDVDNVEQVYISSPAAGSYTVTVDHDGDLTGEEQWYSLFIDGGPATVSGAAPSVTATSPPFGTNEVWIAVSGSGFQLGANVKLTKSGESDIEGEAEQVSPETIVVLFDLTGAALGEWNVVVTNPDTQSDTLASSFFVGTRTYYEESFESGLGSWSQSTGDDLDWTRANYSTASGDTGPTSAHDGSWYLYIEASGEGTGYPYKTAGLEATFDFSDVGDPVLSFYYHMCGANMGVLRVDVSTNGGSSWAEGIWTLVGEQHENESDPWSQAKVNLSAYGGESSVKIRFWGETGSFWNSDMAFDAVTVMDEPQPTFAVITDVEAEIDDAEKVAVVWRTESEVGTVGFQVLRQGDAGVGWTQVGRSFLPGLICSPQGGTYRLVDPTAAPGKSHTYRIVEIEASGKRNRYGPYRVTPRGKRQAAMFQVTSAASPPSSPRGSVSPRAEYTRVPRPLRRHSPDAVMPGRQERDRIRAGAKREARVSALKLFTEGTGAYYLSAAQLASSAGMHERLARILIGGRWVQLTCGGRQTAYAPAKGGAGLYFFGEDIDSLYSDLNVYRLARGKGKRMGKRWSRRPRPAPDGATFVDMVDVEQDVMPLNGAYLEPEEDFWTWDFLVAGYPGMDRKSFPAELHGVAPGDADAGLGIRLRGASSSGIDGEHHVRIVLNGIEMGEGAWTGTAAHDLEFVCSQTILREGTNEVEVIAIQDEGIPHSVVLLDGFDITYSRLYEAVDGELLVRGDGNRVVTVRGFEQRRIHVLDVTDPRMPKVVTGTRVSRVSEGYGVSFVPASPEAEYYVWEAGATRGPEVTVDSPSRLKSRSNAADYLVVSDANMQTAAEELAEHRRGLGMRAAVVDVQDIYDEFSHGLATPHAIRSFLSYAHRRWKEEPMYVVLAGDGTYDYKNIQGCSDNIIPAKRIWTPEGLFVSDNWYADFNEDGMPEIAIGRLPARTVEELRTMVAKTIAYEAAPEGEWCRRALLAADDPDDGGEFTFDSELLSELLPEGCTVERAYLEEFEPGQAREVIVEGLNAGCGLFQYAGHASLSSLAVERIFGSGDVGTLANGSRLPVMTAATCMLGMFGVPGYTSLSEHLLRHADGGVVAVWAPSGSAYNSASCSLLGEFLRTRYGAGEAEVGPAVIGAFERFHKSGEGMEQAGTFILLGDPATVMKGPNGK